LSPNHLALAPMVHPRLDLFLLGYVAGVSTFVALFFLRFWKQTRDSLFLAFAVFFFLQGATRAFVLTTSHPNVAMSWIYIWRLLGVLLVIVAILRKNFSPA
jgi:uncharacterized membrane protein HdeD (DUF308 family)